MESVSVSHVVMLLRKLSIASSISDNEEREADTLALTEKDVKCCQVVVEDVELGKELWPLLHEHAISLAAVKRAITKALEGEGPSVAAALAILAYLLNTADCPVLSLFDCLTASAMLKALRRVSCSKRKISGQSKSIDAPDGDEVGSSSLSFEQQLAWCEAAVIELAALLQRFGLRHQPETVREFGETFAELACSALVPAGLAHACLTALLELLHPNHGTVKEGAAVILRPMSQGLLGLGSQSAKQSGKQAIRTIQSTRAQVLGFIEAALSKAEECQEAVAGLARHLVLKAPDKAEFRAAATDLAKRLMSLLPAADQRQFVVFAARLSRSSKISHRTLGIDLALAFFSFFEAPFDTANSVGQAQALPLTQQRLETSSRRGSISSPRSVSPASLPSAPSTGATVVTVAEPSSGPPESVATCGQVCIAVLMQRASDKSPAVRSKALSGLAAILAEWLEHRSADDLSLLRQALAQAQQVKLAGPYTGNTPVIMAPSTISPSSSNDLSASPMSHSSAPGSAVHGFGASGAPFAQRRGGLHRQLLESALQNAARLSAPILDLDIDSVVLLARRRARDEKGSVRRAALQLMDGLLMMRVRGAGGASIEMPSESDIRAIEAATADPLVSVRRAGLQTASKLLKELPNEAEVAVMWVRAVLPMVRDVEASLQEAVLDQVEALIITKAAAAAGTSAGAPTDAAQNAAESLCCLLSALSGTRAAARVSLSQAVAGLAAKRRTKAERASIGLQNIIAGLGSSKAGSCSGAWMLLAEISAQSPKAASWKFLQEQWRSFKNAETTFNLQDGSMLLQVVANAACSFPEAEAQELAAGFEQAVSSFNLAPESIAAHLAALQQLTAGKKGSGWQRTMLKGCETALANYLQRLANGASTSASDEDATVAVAALFSIGEIAVMEEAKVASSVVTLIRTLAAESVPPAINSGSSAQVLVPEPVQAHAWMALGKVCLVDEQLAKKCILAFVQELQAARASAVRNNIMIVVADMCMRYTALVDGHIPTLAACISDSDELVRRQGLALLANLLSKDFVKWRGALFHRFTLALVDSSPAVRSLAEYLLGDALSTKAPLLAYNHFVESVFVLNGFRDGLVGLAGSGPSSQAELQLSQGNSLGQTFGLRGCSVEMREKRAVIYRVLLNQMAPEHKFATAAKLCQDVLAGFADEVLPLHRASEVLYDALAVLSFKEIKVGVSKSTAAEDDEPESQAAAAGAARGKVVSAIMRKHLVEGMVPVMAELKRMLEARRHPLLPQLMLTLRILLKDHKSEIEDILVADRQLAKELLYDLRQDDLERQAEAAEAQRTSQSPGPQPHLLPRGQSSDASPLTAAGRTVPRRSSGHILPLGTSPGTPVAARVLASHSHLAPASIANLQKQVPAQQHATPSMQSPNSLPTPLAAGTPHRFNMARQTPANLATLASTPANAASQLPHVMGNPTTVPMSVPKLKPSASRESRQILRPKAKLGSLAVTQAPVSPAVVQGDDPIAGEDSAVVVPSPFRSSRRAPWEINHSIGNQAVGDVDAVSENKLKQRTKASPLQAASRASSRLQGPGKKRKAGSRS